MLSVLRTTCLALTLLIGASASLVAATPACAAEVPPIAFTTRTLANGLRVYTSLDAATPNVTVQVWYGVGSKDDPEGRSGFAHLFEHLMFKATRNLPAESFDRLTEDVGGFNNASTADDYTDYLQVIPANHLERLIWAEAERMSTLVVDEASFKSERDVVKEELRQNYLAAPYGRLFGLYLPQASYTTHPYMRPGIGSIEELDAATLDDVRAFHGTYYRPDNAALIIVGNFDAAKLDAWIDRDFGGLKNPAQPLPRVTAKEPPRTRPGIFDGYGPTVPLPAVILSWQGVSAAHPDAPALKVLDAVLSAGKSSRLYNALVYSQQIAVEAYSNADLPRDPGLFMVGAILASGHTIAEGEAALLAEVRRLRGTPPTAAELSEAKNELLASALGARETIEGRASAIGYALNVDGDPNAVNTELAALQRVTAADVQMVARRYLTDAGRMSIRYRPESERPKGQVAAPTAPSSRKAAVYEGSVYTLAPEAERQRPPPVGEPVPAILPKPAEKVLANGLRVIVARSSSLPLVTADLTVKVGAWADPQGLGGATSMIAGMLTEGTKTRSAQAIARQTEALGASLGSGGGRDSSSVTLTVMRDKLAAGLSIMSDVARNPVFAAGELARQREQALDGLKVAYQQPSQIASLTTAPIIFAGTPLGHPIVGTPATLARLTPTALTALHRTWFRPDNAILVLTGDITAEAGFAAAEQAYGGWARPTAPLPLPPPITPVSKVRAVAIDIPGADQASVNVVALGVARSDPDYIPGQVATTVLGGGYSARLNQEIRIKRGLSYGAGAGLSAARTTGTFRANADTKNVTAGQVLDLIMTELSVLHSAPVGAEELRARKSILVGGYGRELATSSGLADVLGNAALYGLPTDELGLYVAKIEAVTPAEIQAFAARHLKPEGVSVVVVGDSKVFGEALKAKVPNLEVIASDQLDLDSPTLRQKAK